MVEKWKQDQSPQKYPVVDPQDYEGDLLDYYEAKEDIELLMRKAQDKLQVEESKVEESKVEEKEEIQEVPDLKEKEEMPLNRRRM